MHLITCYYNYMHNQYLIINMSFVSFSDSASSIALYRSKIASIMVRIIIQTNFLFRHLNVLCNNNFIRLKTTFGSMFSYMCSLGVVLIMNIIMKILNILFLETFYEDFILQRNPLFTITC